MNRLHLFLVACLVALCPLAAGAQEDDAERPGTFFPVESLNAGLEPAPDWIDRTTPQGAVESFLDAVDRVDGAAAAHVLNLSEIPVPEQAQRGPRLAMELAEVLERRAVISWRQLLERPDGLDARQSTSVAMAGEPRRSLLIGIIEEGRREAAIRLNRVKPDGGDPVWVFSARTVDQVPALYDRYGPSRLERALPDWAKRSTLFGVELWEAVGLPVALVVAWLAGRLTHVLFHRLALRTRSARGQIALTAIRWPSIIVVTTSVILYAALGIFSVSGTVSSILTPLTLVGYVIAVLMFAMSVLDTALDRMVTFDAARLADPENSTARTYATLLTAGRRAVMVVGVVVGVGIVLAAANVLRSVGFSLLASAGAVTLVLGFAARHVLGNILASLQIAMNRSARIGDRIVIDGEYAIVERIHFTYIQLKTMKDNRLVVPVSTFINDSFENWSMVDGGMTCHVQVTFAQTVDFDAMLERFMDLVRDEPLISDPDTACMWAMSQDALGITVRFQFRVDAPTETWTTERKMQERILKAAQDLEAETGRPVLPSAVAGADGAG